MKNQKDVDQEKDEKTPFEKLIAGLKLRGIGPAVMGGRIIDIAVHPTRPTTWYVAAGSGGLWKTTNAGTTWNAVFEDQPSYSIGCVTLDPTNPEVVWVGTGENVSGRHVGWGDGVYRSRNGGASWEQVGLEKSEHIGKILVDPRDGQTVYVAAEGPLWSAGGERGVYKTTDQGETWSLLLEIDEHTGVTDIAFNPSNPDTLYAAAYQRRRHIWALMAGGPGSGIYKTTDGGKSWRKISKGLPKGDMGKIGLAVTPADPEIVYATIEAQDEEKGFYRSSDQGESWEKRNSYISGGTGPHYYQVIAASPVNRDIVYQMDVFVHMTSDGGKTMQKIDNGRGKHSDNHAIWIDPQNGAHLLVGADAGLYETFDNGESWRHFPNMPLAQFYRTAVDNSEPFYNILGGAQDLGTLYGPSRTLHIEGVRNQDWYVPIGADGYHVAFDPEEPHIMYMEFQIGNIFRYDKRSEEALDIQPQPAPGEPPERWNWDCPILISPHNHHRIYVASQRVWRSDNRGDSWTPISDDLTRNQNRYELPIADRVWSVDDLYDNGAMSRYASITNLTESPLVEGLLYAATDDGLIQVTENGGDNWRLCSPLPDMPEEAFIQCVEASLHDADTVFAIGDAHKIGDFRPYLFVSRDRGQSWTSLNGDLPENTILWAIQQDHTAANLLFLAAEYGLYASVNGGENWHKLSGVPTIAFRDLKLQRRENDLVGASFGRGFYVLDDYTPLREVAEIGVDALEAAPAHLFGVRDSWWYVPYVPMQAPTQPTLGTTAFKAPNPPFGALLSYFLPEKRLDSKEVRHKMEKALRKEGQDIPFPGWETLQGEQTRFKPEVWIEIRDEENQTVRRLSGPTEAGFHRISWDLRHTPPDPIDLDKPADTSPWSRPPAGPLAAPGNYTAQLYLVDENGVRPEGEARPFAVKPLVRDGDLGADLTSIATFQQETAALSRRLNGVGVLLKESKRRLEHLRAALHHTPAADHGLSERLHAANVQLGQLKATLYGDPARQALDESTVPSIAGMVGRVVWGHWYTRQNPTETQQTALSRANAELETLEANVKQLVEVEIMGLEQALARADAPWTPGRNI